MTIRMLLMGVIVVLGPLLAGAQEEGAAPGGASADEPGERRPVLSPDQAVELARERFESGDTAAALDIVRRALRINPGHARANLLAGEMLMAEENYNGARDYFMQVLQAEPANFEANLNLGQIWIANRSWRQATYYLEQAERVAPRDERAEVKRLLAFSLAGEGKIGPAIAKAQEAVSISPNDYDVIRTLAEILQRVAGRDPRMVEQMLRASEQLVALAAGDVDGNPGDQRAVARLELAYQYELSALTTYYQSLQLTGPRGEPLDQVQPGREAEAADALLELAKTRDLHQTVRATLTTFDTIELLGRAVELQPEDVEALELLAQKFRVVRAQDAAVGVYQRILELAPDHEEAKSYLTRVGAPLEAEKSEEAAGTGGSE